MTLDRVQRILHGWVMIYETAVNVGDNDSFFLHNGCFDDFDDFIIFTHDVVFYDLSYFDAQDRYIEGSVKP